jgi:methyl-accepting chemotaxis protein
MFPQFFTASVSQRAVVWGCILLALALLYVAIDVIHASNLQGFLNDMQKLVVASKGGDVSAPDKLAELQSAMNGHTASNTRNKIMLSLLLFLVFGQMVWLEYHWLVRPVIGMSAALSENGQGTGARNEYINKVAMQRDEVGALGRVLVQHLASAAAKQNDAVQKVTSLSEQLAEQQRIEQASSAFRGAITRIVGKLEGQAAEMAKASGDLKSLSGNVDVQAADTARLIERASASVGVTAASINDFAASVIAIAEKSTSASEAAQSACALVSSAQTDAQDLRDAVGLIDQMVQLISNVAAQTNLLALNATIEAARAGQHGRGFAVVASEVKQLAEQTSKATSDAGMRLAAIRAAADRITSRILSVVSSVTEISQVAKDISMDMQHQGESSRKISQNTTMAAEAVLTGAEKVRQVSVLVKDADLAASSLTTISSSLLGQADELRLALDSFIEKNRRIAA